MLPEHALFLCPPLIHPALSIHPVMEPVLAIREYLEYVVVRLILHPEEAGVSHEENDGRHLFRIRLHPDDAGRVIGRNGRTIAAIRCLALASAEKHGLRIAVELDEPVCDAV